MSSFGFFVASRAVVTRKLLVATLCLYAFTVSATLLRGQGVTFSGDQTPPSASLTGPQVTTGPGTSAVNLGSVVVCPGGLHNAACTETQVLAYTVQLTGTLGPTQVVTEGVPGLDYTLSYSSCTGPQEPGATCLVGLSFTPVAPGLRRGAVTITDASAHPLATTYLYGNGIAPAVGFSPPAETNITTGLNAPQGVAVNAYGDVFYTDRVQGTLLKVPQNARDSQVVLDAGFSNPSGVALDGAGNLYIADTGHDLVLKVPPGGGPGVLIGSGLSAPAGVAVDGLGDVYISEPASNSVIVVPMTGGPQVAVGSGYSNPMGIALDTAGDLFVADYGNRRVVKVPANGGPQVPVGIGFSGPMSVAVDAAGNIFVGDVNSDGIIEVPADGSLQFTLGDGFIRPTGMALGDDGSLYIADLSHGEVVYLDRNGPPNLTFASTVAGSISSDSPKWVTAENIGNAPLFVYPPPVAMDPDFVLVHGPTALPYCTGGVTVPGGSGCVLSISFQPQSIGTFNSAYVLADNALNSNFNQSIGLSGTSTGIVPQLHLNFNPQAYYGSTFNAVALSNSPGTITYSLVSGPATVSSTGLVHVIGEGTVTVLASQAASGNYLAATATGSFQAVQAGTTTSLTAALVGAGFGVAAKLMVTVHPDTSGTPTGLVFLFDGSTLLSKLTLAGGVATYKTAELLPGTHTFAASYGGDGNFAESVSSGTTVEVPGSTVKLRVADTTVVFPRPVQMEVHVDKSGKKEPHGRVEILDGGVQIASFHLYGGEDGNSEPLRLKLARGVHVLTAYYEGDPRYEPGVSAAVTVTVK